MCPFFKHGVAGLDVFFGIRGVQAYRDDVEGTAIILGSISAVNEVGVTVCVYTDRYIVSRLYRASYLDDIVKSVGRLAVAAKYNLLIF